MYANRLTPLSQENGEEETQHHRWIVVRLPVLAAAVRARSRRGEGAGGSGEGEERVLAAAARRRGCWV